MEKAPADEELRNKARYFCSCPEQWRSVSRYSPERMQCFVEENQFREQQNLQGQIFDLVQRGDLNKTERERIKQASRDLLAGVMAVIAPLDRWTEKEQTQAEVEIFIMDQVYLSLPEPPYTPQDKADVAQLVYQHIRQQSLRA